MNKDFLTTAQAARRAGTSRPTVSRALKNGDLEAIRDNGGRWIISADAVDLWAGIRSSVHHEQRASSVQEIKDSSSDEHLNTLEQVRKELGTARETIARLEGESAVNKERITDLMKDRDALREALAQAALASRANFWTRIFGR